MTNLDQTLSRPARYGIATLVLIALLWAFGYPSLVASETLENHTGHALTISTLLSILILVIGYLVWRERSAFIALRHSERRHSKATEAQAKAVVESESRLRTIVDGSIQGILIHKDSKPLFVNKAYATIHGYSDPSEILEMPSTLSLVAPDEQENLNTYAAARLRGDDAPARYEYKGVRKDGAEIWLENIAIPTRWEGQDAIQATVIDVTEQVELREQVQKTEALLHNALNTMPTGFVLYDADDRLTLFNEAYRRTFPTIGHLLKPGLKFEDFVREGAERGLVKGVIGRVDDYVKERMEQHRNPVGPLEYEQTRGNWIRAEEWRMPGGGFIGIRTDITEQKMVEKTLAQQSAALRASETRFRDFAESTSDWLWEMDADLRFTYMSENVERIVGVPAEWHYGKTREDLLGPDYDRDVWSAHLEILNNHKPFRDFEFYRTGEGVEPKWLSSSGIPTFDKSGAFAGYRGTGRDITSRKKIEDALAISEGRLRAIIDASPSMITLKDANRRYLVVNKAYTASRGISIEDAIGANTSELGANYQADIVDDYDRQVLETRETVMYERSAVGPDGALASRSVVKFPAFDIHGELLGVGTISTDVSARKQAEVALRASEAQLRLVSDSLPVLIAYIDRDLRYRFVNKACTEWLGRDAADILGQRVKDIHPRVFSTFSHHIEKVLSGNPVSFEDTVSYPDGVTRDTQVFYTPRHSDDGGVDGYYALVEDISERKVTEAKLQQAQKMEAVGQLTGGIAHDFNNLLGVIMGNLELLLETPNDGEGRTSMLESAVRAAQRGAELTHRLLAFSRKQTLAPEIVDLNALVTGMIGFVERTLGETISVQSILAPKLAKVNIDPGQMEAALLNLAVNAGHAMPKGGQLTIETGNTEFSDAEAAKLEGVAPGPYAMLAVSDTGSGMKPGVLAQVFEPFFTTKEVGEGTGLGLSMVHGFIKQSEGHISIHSRESEGTSVKLYFPAHQDAAQPAPLSASPASSAPIHKGDAETILIVEDDPDLRELAILIITQLGYKTLEADDGPSAVAVLETDSPIDLLFTDVILPGGMSGPDIAARARDLRPDMSILFTSGYPENALEDNEMDPGMIEIIGKPYRQNVLAQRIRAILDK